MPFRHLKKIRDCQSAGFPPGGPGKEEEMLVNLTPHAISVLGEDGEVLMLSPSGQVARVTSSCTQVGALDGVPVVKTEYGTVENLPAPEAGKVFVVSVLVAQQCAGREDVVSPDTGPDSAVRDADGRIIGVKRFMRF